MKNSTNNLAVLRTTLAVHRTALAYFRTFISLLIGGLAHGNRAKNKSTSL